MVVMTIFPVYSSFVSFIVYFGVRTLLRLTLCVCVVWCVCVCVCVVCTSGCDGGRLEQTQEGAVGLECVGSSSEVPSGSFCPHFE